MVEDKIRPMIKFVKEKGFEQPLVGCEVGVWKGDNAKSILTNLNMKQLFLVDPWKKHRIHNGRLFGQAKMELIMQTCIAKLLPFKDKKVMIRKTSRKGATHVPDSLDFVYIDTIHTYKEIKRDINKWFPKVKPGGVFGGHDYYQKETPGVCRGVDEFVEEHDLKLYQDDIDWWVVKPDNISCKACKKVWSKKYHFYCLHCGGLK